MINISDYIILNGELYHHGILGQKWGVRRYQNKDGSLTAAGRKHYNVGETLDRAIYNIRSDIHTNGQQLRQRGLTKDYYKQFRKKNDENYTKFVKAFHAEMDAKIKLNELMEKLGVDSERFYHLDDYKKEFNKIKSKSAHERTVEEKNFLDAYKIANETSKRSSEAERELARTNTATSDIEQYLTVLRRKNLSWTNHPAFLEYASRGAKRVEQLNFRDYVYDGRVSKNAKLEPIDMQIKNLGASLFDTKTDRQELKRIYKQVMGHPLKVQNADSYKIAYTDLLWERLDQLGDVNDER